jgi:hypothetical protein
MSEETEISQLSVQFISYMLETVRILPKRSYSASHFHQMLSADNDGLAIARRLVMADASDGLWRLHELGRLDLSVEMSILLPEYEELFDQVTRDRAFSKLSDLDFNFEAHLRALASGKLKDVTFNLNHGVSNRRRRLQHKWKQTLARLLSKREINL